VENCVVSTVKTGKIFCEIAKDKKEKTTVEKYGLLKNHNRELQFIFLVFFFNIFFNIEMSSCAIFTN
jgi:hypothetical protein